MSDHMPECPLLEPCSADTPNHGFCSRQNTICIHCERECICPELRACEQRVRNQDIATHHADLKEAKALLASRDEAWFAGVEAAREAVAALPEYRMRDTCIAAIDELREEKK